MEPSFNLQHLYYTHHTTLSSPRHTHSTPNKQTIIPLNTTTHPTPSIVHTPQPKPRGQKGGWVCCGVEGNYCLFVGCAVGVSWA
ncbi:hypothetical protein [Bacteriophage sp.]|nr:hypothetical protein [Bacteriophage sp.]